jgi:hypothetical protein
MINVLNVLLITAVALLVPLRSFSRRVQRLSARVEAFQDRIAGKEEGRPD